MPRRRGTSYRDRSRGLQGDVFDHRRRLRHSLLGPMLHGLRRAVEEGDCRTAGRLLELTGFARGQLACEAGYAGHDEGKDVAETRRLLEEAALEVRGLENRFVLRCLR